MPRSRPRRQSGATARSVELVHVIAVTYKGQAGIAVGMDEEPIPVPAEELVGKDELDEDDEMVLSADDLVQEDGE